MQPVHSWQQSQLRPMPEQESGEQLQKTEDNCQQELSYSMQATPCLRHDLPFPNSESFVEDAQVMPALAAIGAALSEEHSHVSCKQEACEALALSATVDVEQFDNVQFTAREDCSYSAADTAGWQPVCQEAY